MSELNPFLTSFRRSPECELKVLKVRLHVTNPAACAPQRLRRLHDGRPKQWKRRSSCLWATGRQARARQNLRCHRVRGWRLEIWRARDSDATPSSKQGRRIWTRELARGGLWERTSRSSTDIYYATPQTTACERFTRAARRFTLPPLHSHCLQKRPRTLGFKDDPGASNSKTPYCASAPKTIASMSTSAPRACAGVTNDPKVGLRKEK